MIICTNCGNHNEDTDEFCGSCGKFLEWVGERVAAPAAPVAEAEPEVAVETKVGLIDRVKAAVGVDSGGVALADKATEPTAEEQAAAAEAAAEASRAQADQQRLAAEAAVAAERAATAADEARVRDEEEARARAEAEAALQAQAEARARAAEEAEAARRAEQEARRRTEDEVRAAEEAERRRVAEAEASARARAEAEARASAEADAAAAAEAARLALEAAAREADQAAREASEAEAARRAEEARVAEEAAQAARESEAEAKRQQDLEARAREEAENKAQAEEAARRQAEDAARAAQESEARAKAEATERARAEEAARLRAEDEARAKLAAQARAREEEAARKRAAALLARPKVTATPVEEGPPAADPFVTPAAEGSPATDAGHRPAAQVPTAQQPSTAKAPPRPDPRITAAGQTIKQGDLVCSQCGSGNDPTRKFCRKCGNSLAQAVTAKKVPWWKKIFGKGRKNRISKDATEQARRKQRAHDASFKTQMALAKIKKALMFLMLVGVVGGAFAFPSARGTVTRWARDGSGGIQDIFNPKVASVIPLEPTATSAVGGKEPKFASDLVVNSFWSEGAEGDGVGQTISFSFAEPTDLTKVLITSGNTDTLENYLNNPRPKDLHLVFDNGGSADITLSEGEFRKAEGFNLKGAKAVSKVDIVIASVYPGRGGTETGLAEVEFKKKG